MLARPANDCVGRCCKAKKKSVFRSENLASSTHACRDFVTWPPTYCFSHGSLSSSYKAGRSDSRSSRNDKHPKILGSHERVAFTCVPVEHVVHARPSRAPV